MKIIAIGGEPGAGKSTLMREIIKEYDFQEKYNSFKIVPYLQHENIYILGKYEDGEVFSGTDRMSMAAQPEVIKFLKTLDENAVVLLEGDRLFNSSFLEYCVDNYTTDVIYLSTDREVRQERYAERGSEQNETWLQGRETKISNILTNMLIMFHTTKFHNNNLEDQKHIIEYIMNHLEG